MKRTLHYKENMKQLLLTALALLMWIGITPVAMAQTGADEAAKELVKRAEERTAEMTKRYDLNKEQQAAFLRLNTKYERDLEALHKDYNDSTATDEAKTTMKEAVRELEDQFDEMAQNLLSDKQWGKYQLDREKQRAEEAANDENNKMTAWGPMAPGQNLVNLLGWNPQAVDSVKIAQKHTDTMAKKYKLTDEQKEKLLALNQAEVKAEMDERRAMAKGIKQEDMQELSEAAKTRSENYEKYLKTILTEEQFKKYQNSRKAQQSRRQNWGGPRWMW